MQSTIAGLRCDRCRHQWRHHGLQGCLVCKVKWDDEAQGIVAVDPCGCRWYIGELPPPDVVVECPHEVQDQADDTGARHVCVHCGKKLRKGRRV